MNTFLPYPSYTASAKVLDNKRLWKQCVEAKQLVLGQFPNHPAAKMWKGYEYQLCLYGIDMCLASLHRGIDASNVMNFFAQKLETFTNKEQPPWLGDERIHASHRSNLLRKDLVHYGQFGWKESSAMPYYWPVK